jgi:hypothetical protein
MREDLIEMVSQAEHALPSLERMLSLLQSLTWRTVFAESFAQQRFTIQ